jgi:hypothetical protein
MSAWPWWLLSTLILGAGLVVLAVLLVLIWRQGRP